PVAGHSAIASSIHRDFPTVSTHFTLTLHDALPIYGDPARGPGAGRRLVPPGGIPEARNRRSFRDAPHELRGARVRDPVEIHAAQDRKSTRLNSSHVEISYAVFCLKKKNSTKEQ